jgi:tetratricopeptide (TPR) repeat protein
MELNRMNRLYTVIIAFIILTATGLSNPVKVFKKEILRGKELIYQFDLVKAEHYFDSLIQTYPNQPIPYFYRGYIKLILFSQDMVNEKLMKGLESDFQNCVENIRRIPDYEKDSRLTYYLGLSYGAIGIRYALDQSYLKAYWYGRKGKSYLEKSARLDTTFYDVYLGLGIYHYYIGLMPGIIKFFARLLGFSGNREVGLLEIARCAKKGEEFKTEAQLAEDVIRYFMQNELDRIYSIAKLGTMYPRNPVIPMLVGYHFRRTGYPEKAIPYFLQVQDSVKSYVPQIYQMKYYNLAVCRYLMNEFTDVSRILNVFLKPEMDRMTEYYQSAYHYYTGLLYLIQGKIPEGKQELSKIPDKKHTSFWFLTAEPFRYYRISSPFRWIIEYRNNVFSHKFQNRQLEEKILKYYDLNHKDLWYYYYLDSKGMELYLRGKYREALKVFNHLYQESKQFEKARYFKKWVLLHFGRTLIKLHKYDEAKSLVEMAKDIRDDYIKFIAERELFIIKNSQNKEKKE